MSGNVAVIVAGGKGLRLGREGGKQLALVAGKPVLVHTLEVFDSCEAIDEIVVVVDPPRAAEYTEVINRAKLGKVSAIVPGGDTRLESVSNGLSAVAEDASLIVVHDGARPLVTAALIEDAVAGLASDPAIDGVVVGHPSYDTVKSVTEEGYVDRTEDRERLWVVQTPQVFRPAVLRSAYADARATGFSGTDDASIVEHAGGRVGLVRGLRDNIKVTVPEDLVVVDALLARRVAPR